MSAFVQPRPNAAVRIVAPSDTTVSTLSATAITPSSRESSPSKPTASQKKVPKCRNILIHGFCKNEGKGCIYDHSDGSTTAPGSSVVTPTVSSPTPSAATVNVNAPIFVPKTTVSSSSTGPLPAASPDPFKPAYLRDEAEAAALAEQQTTAVASPILPYSTSADYNLAASLSQTRLDPSSSYHSLDPMVASQMYPSSSSGYLDTLSSQGYYGPIPAYTHQPPNYHLYTRLPYLPPASAGPTPSRIILPAPHRFFMSDTIREDLHRRSEALYAPPPPQPQTLPGGAKPLPEEVHTYHTLVPLEDTEMTKDAVRRKWFVNCSSVVYRATHKEDGSVVVLRRIEGFRLTQEAAFTSVELWSRTRHPNIVHLREAFTTRAFGDYSVVFVYDFHPTAQTLYQLHVAPPDQQQYGPNHHPLVQMQPQAHHAHPHHPHNGQTSSSRSRRYHRNKSNTNTNANSSSSTGHNNTNSNGSNNLNGGTGSGSEGGNAGALGLIDERVLWSVLVQVANAIKEIHERGLAARGLDATKIIVTGKNRVRLNCCGIFDVLTYDARMNVEALHQEDLLAFGRLVLQLCTRNANAAQNLQKSMEIIQRYYSPDVKNVVLFLISKPAPNKIIDQLLDMFGTRLLTEMNALANYSDQLEGDFMGELENGRLVRLMAKFGFINERPEFSHDARWSETGDRYIVSLFRDYVFHQVDETGHPVVDMTHVLTCLNKVDVGTDERIMLVSRDEQTCLVVSYKDIKACIESAFGELAPTRSAR